MNLLEHQARGVLESHGLPVPRGALVTSPAEARQVALSIGGPVVVKAQVPVGGRGKAGGVRLARDPEQAAVEAEQVLGLTIKGHAVKSLLVVEAASIARELYLSVAVDRATKSQIVMATTAGGVDVEEVARTSPSRLLRLQIDPLLGLTDFQARELAFGLELPREQVGQFVAIARGLYATSVARDATLVEVNPLAVTSEGRLLCLDAKLVVDDNALCRQSELAALRDDSSSDPLEAQARAVGLSYVHLDGSIGCIVNGAGLAMGTMDVIKLHGGSPANFLDIGGGARAGRVVAALRIVTGDPAVKVVLFNVFGGITRCCEVARGIVQAKTEVGLKVPIVVRLVGTNEEEGRQILAGAGITAVLGMDEAARAAIAAQAASE